MSIESMEFKKFSNNSQENETLLTDEMYQENLCKLAERIFVNENFIGKGNTADVFSVPEMTNVCCKKLNHSDIKPINSLEEEAEYLDKLSGISEKVLVPTPVVTIEVVKKVEKKNLRGEMVSVNVRESALLMKEIDGVSIEDILEERVQNPAEFLEHLNVEEFFSELGNFIDTMNERGIHHRDLHPGNIMIERGTLKPVVIDFGHAAKKYGDEDIYKENVFKRDFDGRMKEVVETFISDKQRVEQAKIKILDEIKMLTLNR